MSMYHNIIPDTTKFQVTVAVSLDKIPHFTEYLINENISFSLNLAFNTEDGEEPENVLNNAIDRAEDEMSKKYLSEIRSVKEALKKICEDYLVNGIEQVPPNEKLIASNYNIKISTFKAYFKDNFGKTFYQLYMEKKMHHAAYLLERGFKAREVSRIIGYSTGSDIKFNKMFQKYFGTTPKKYQIARLSPTNDN